MKSNFVFETASGRARVATIEQVRELDAWQDGLRHLAKDHRYHEIVAGTLGFDCRALVLESRGGQVLAIQPFFFVEQDLMVAAPAVARLAARCVRKIFPRFLRPRMLMVGCAAGEGHLGAGGADPRAIAAELRQFMPHVARAHNVLLVVWKDFPAQYRDALMALKGAPKGSGHVQIASMPATRLALDFTSFEDYLARRLSHPMRKNLRRKFKALAAAPPIVLTVTNDLGDAVDDALALYLQVFSRSPLKFERLTKVFLQQLAVRMPERVRFFLWRQEGRLVAFSLCLMHDGVIYDEYLGLDYDVALALNLYFVTFRDVLSWAIAQGLKTYCSTPLNYDPKLHLGFDLAPLDIYFALSSPALNPRVHPLIKRISPTRAEPVLARFANAHEMTPEE